MKILNIYFKNINSFEGENRLHFDRAPLSDAGVFAITGPNGSGKTTILDVITLGLYGETYRFDKPAEHVMTKHTRESIAQVEFALGKERYRARWQVRRDDDSEHSEISSPEMTLTRLNGEEQILADKASLVRSRITELTGMDLHKFSKSMVLAQGDFAAFLNALDSERMDILEKITGGDIFLQYQAEAEQRYEQIQIRLAELKQDLEATPLMEEAAVEARQHDLEDFQAQMEVLKAEQNELEKKRIWTEKISGLDSRISELQNNRLTLQQSRNKYQQTLDEITRIQSVLKFKDEASALNKHIEQIDRNEKTLENFRKEVLMLQQQLERYELENEAVIADRPVNEQKQTVDQLKLKLSELKQQLPQEDTLLQSVSQQLAEKKKAFSELEKWLQENKHDQKLLSEFPEIGKLKSLRTELANLHSKQAAHAKWSKKTTSALKKNKEQIKNRSKAIKQLKKRMAANQQAIKDITRGKTFEELEDLKLEQQERVSNFLELYELAKANERVSKKGLLGFLVREQHFDEDVHQLEEALHIVQLELAKEENIRKTLEKAVAYEALLKKMQADRDKLEDGRPCPLCGSIHHPYVNNPPQVSDSKTALAEQRGKVKTLMSRLDSISLKIKEVQKLELQKADKDNRLQLVRSQWQTLSNRMNVAGPRMDINNLSAMKKLLKEERKQLKEVNKLIKRCFNLHGGLEKFEADVQRNEHALDRLKVENKQLDAEWDNRPRELVELEKAYEKCKHDETTLAGQVEKQLLELGEKMPAKGSEDALFDRLNQRRQHYQAQQKHQMELSRDIESLQEKVAICQQDVDALNHQLAEQSAALHCEEGVAFHLTLIEKQKLVAGQEQALNNQQQQFESLQRELAEKLTDTPFSNLDELNDAIRFVERRNETQQLLREEEQKLSQMTGEIQLLEKELEREQSLAISTLSEAELLQKQRELTEKLEITEQEIRTLENLLSKQEVMREKAAGLQSQLEDQYALLKESEAEMASMKGENALAFRRKVQQEMIDRLLAQANQILEKISGRYYVRSVPSEYGFALEIEDTQQNNSRRFPKTLSGGESFVVSLALALALAESAVNGHAIDSLFLDEGFGNLDAESLYLVMTTLESLKTHGKTVGIISHVDGVKKRVKTRIETVKKANGLSSLKMAS